MDDNPISGTITTNGNTYSSGNVIQVIGTNTITANPSPSGSWAFNSWSVSNSVNLSISSLTSNPATFTVMGDGIVTASWNGISKFAESGLPAGTQWSVAFNNITQNSIAPNSIIFSTPPGNYTFSVANVVVGNAIYIPSPQNSLTVAGNSIEIDFAKIFVIFSGEKPVPVSSTNDKLNIIINNNILKGMNIIFNSNINFNMSVNIASPPPNSRFYNEIKIAENKSVDQNVTSVIYNFSVPKSYVNSQNISNSNIKLFKNVSNGWLALPTVYTGSNSTAYFYYATSNSLSTYAVGFTTGNAIGTSTPLSLTLPSGYYTYFFGYGGLSGLAGTTAGSAFSDNWTTSVNYTTTISAKGKAQYNMSNIGYMVQKITGTVSGGTAPINVTLVGVGANVILGNGATYTNSGSSTSLSLSYTVSTSNSFAIIILAAGGSAFSAAPTTTATGCSLSQDISSSTAASAAIFVCNSIAAGSYTASATTTKASAWSAAAYIFPPYSVTLDDIPSTYTITTNGNTYSSGTVIQVIGTNTITANPPAGYEFSHWSVSNIINLTLSSSIANPATLTVMGNGIVTATYAIPTGIPSNILNYTPVTLTYNGLATYPNPFQQFIPVNALNYTQYMTYNSNFANFEYFYENGTIIPAWIESDTSNTLRTWAKVSNTIFSYTGSGTATNTIYLGFASNTLNLLSSSGTSGIGEAPQLSSTYAEYDDGASVFPLYANFAGTSLPSTFAVNKTGSGESYSVNNGLGMTTTSREAATVLLYSSSAYNPADYVGYAGVKTNRNVGNGNPIGFYTNNVISSITGYTIDYGQNNENGSAGVYMQVLNKGTSASINPSITKSITTGNYFIYSYYWEATGEEFAAVNYTISASATNSLIPIGPAYLGERVSVGSGGAQITTNTIWIRLCAAPPNDVMPSSATGAVYKKSTLTLESTGFTATDAKIDGGQLQTLTAQINGGGVSPYTYNFLVYNSIGLVANALYAGVSATSNSFAFTQNSAWGTGTFTANVFITDSSSPPESASNTLTYTAYPTLVAPAITAPTAPNTIYVGQSITVSASSASGGTGSYSYAWSVVSGTSCPDFSNPGNVLSFTYTPFGLTSSCEFEVTATDTGTTTPDTATSAPTAKITVIAHAPAATPANVLYYFPIVLYNNQQSTATPAPFQQFIPVNALNYTQYMTYNSNFANFEYFYSNSMIIPSWIESNQSHTIATWVNIANGIPAGNFITIYLGFASNTLNLLSSSGTSGIGEAPQLTCGPLSSATATSSCATYGAYDDGASVFNNYWNFAGNTLPSGWTDGGVAAPYVIVGNYLLVN
ncbi:MAG: PGF-pre-PGF domain-containing protein, partial [Candidatus Micrarchaeaceae archaeon]